MILSQAQAEAVYSAMCAPNNVGAEFTRVEFQRERVAVVRHYKSDSYEVQSDGRCAEEYDDQAAFATAYGLF